MSWYRKEKLIEKLLKFRWRKYNFDLIKVECYDTFSNDRFMCRMERFKAATGYKDRLMKHEAPLDEKFVMEGERKFEEIMLIRRFT